MPSPLHVDAHVTFMAHPVLPDHYCSLGLSKDASPVEIRTRYYQLVRLYHPNRHQGSDDSKRGLVEHFHHIQTAWDTLSNTNRRRRYNELLDLADAEHKARRGVVDFTDAERGVGQSTDEFSPMSPIDAKHWADQNWSDPAAHRKQLERLQHRELRAFYRYQDAMIAKLQAEEEAERLYEIYADDKWRRESFQNSPKETSERVRIVQRVRRVVKAWQSTRHAPSRRPNRSPTTSYPPQLKTSGSSFTHGSYLSPDNMASIDSRLGYSSDITGDQTSSEDESFSPYGFGRLRMPGRSFPRPFPASQSGRQLGGPAHSKPDPPTPEQSSSGSEETRRPHNPPELPTLLVKRPTGFEEDPRLQHADSSADSGSDLSQSVPTPLRNGCTDMIPFAPWSPARASSSQVTSISRHLPSSYHRRHHSADLSSEGSDVESMASQGRSVAFEKKTLGRRLLVAVPFEYVLDLRASEKDRLLLPEDHSKRDAEQLLARFAELDPHAAANFIVKPDIKTNFHFRLIFSDGPAVRSRHESFIALSYRRKIQVEKRTNDYNLPLAEDMFQAVLEERASSHEGIWIDQICIDQDCDDERTLSMSAMDMVYRSARLIVVALDDIELTAKESLLLESHMTDYAAMSHVAPNKRFRRKQPPHFETHEDLSQVVQKLLSSPWFRRAWCRHEMRLAKDHVFLLHCRSAANDKSGSIIRFTGECLAHLIALATEVPFEESSENLKAALYAFFRDRTRSKAMNAARRLQHGNFTTVVADVFAMDAGGDPRLEKMQRDADARKDQLQIILNTMEVGLTLSSALKSRHVMVSQSECYYMLTLLALAAGDPGALCTVGRPMSDIGAWKVLPPAKTTWLFEPTNIDAGLNNFRTLVPLPASEFIAASRTSSEPSSHFVELDLKLLNNEYRKTSADGVSDSGNSGKVTVRHTGRPRASTITRTDQLQHMMTLAEDFVSKCKQRGFGRQRKRYLWNDKHNAVFGNMRDIYVRTLACMFHLGPYWLAEICRHYHVSRWKQDLESAQWLLITLHNTDGRWPDESNDRAPWLKDAAGFLMDVANFLVIRGMPQRQITQKETWYPICVQTVSNGKLLTFAPTARGEVQSAIPCTLLGDEYIRLARLWILERRPASSATSGLPEYTLLGKSVLFSDTRAMAMVDDGPPHVSRQRSRIFGRSV